MCILWVYVAFLIIGAPQAAVRGCQRVYEAPISPVYCCVCGHTPHANTRGDAKPGYMVEHGRVLVS